MSYFLYAIDTITKLAADTIKKVGLDHIRGPVIERAFRGPGPGGTACTLVAEARCPSKKLNFDPACQRWEKSVNGKFWIGGWHDDPPTEATLRRDSQIEGNPVVLDDGNEWTVPCARVFNPNGVPNSKLPFALIGDEDGVQFRMKSEFVEFSNDAERLWEQLMTQSGLCDGQTLTFDEEYRLCLRALAINYHVGLDEINWLEVLTTANLNKIGPAIVDFEAFAEFIQNKVKKK